MADIKVTATVRLHKDDSGFFIDATLDAALPPTTTIFMTMLLMTHLRVGRRE